MNERNERNPEPGDSLESYPASANENIPAEAQEQNPMEDTNRIQKAIEKIMDDETSSLPLLPHPELPEEASDDSQSQAEPSGKANEEVMTSQVQVHRWFFTFMCMNIPIVGWIYLFYLAFNKKAGDRRDFAKAYLFYKLVFLIVSAVILGILIYIGLGLLDQLLAYMEML